MASVEGKRDRINRIRSKLIEIILLYLEGLFQCLVLGLEKIRVFVNWAGERI